MLPNDAGAGRFATFGAANQTANNTSGFPMGGMLTLCSIRQCHGAVATRCDRVG